MIKFVDRYEAGKLLAIELISYKNGSNVIVLALPRGGVPVAFEIANRLSLPLDVFIVRKLGMPGHKELAMGAIASGGICVFNENIFRETRIPNEHIDAVIESEKKELLRREKIYRQDRPTPNLKDKIIILVDDGIATGATVKAAIMALRPQGPANIIVAVPIAPLLTYQEISLRADKVICLIKPEDFYAVGAYYNNFTQTRDKEVSGLLDEANKRDF
jgi:putative phosphoribosyl transferase